MKITDILKTSTILVHQNLDEKQAVLSKMISALSKSGQISDIEEVTRVVWDRENIMSTGIGKGFALPHGKTNSVSETVGCFLTLDKPIDFEALDSLPVNIIFMLIGRENTVGTHLRLLSRISRLMNNDTFRVEIANAQSSEEILALFEREEDNIH